MRSSRPRAWHATHKAPPARSIRRSPASPSACTPTAPGTLVTINPATGLVTVVGSFAITSTLSDISFDPTTGTMWGWQAAGGHFLHSVNLTTGVASPIGPGTGEFGGGGLAIPATGGPGFLTPDGVTKGSNGFSTLSSIYTEIADLSDDGVVGAMAFDGAGVLFGINGLGGGAGARSLVTIDTVTGAVTVLGATANNIDALAFQASAVPEPTTIALMGVGAAGVGASLWRRKRAVRKAKRAAAHLKRA